MSHTNQILLDLKRTHLTPEQQSEIADRISQLLTKYPHLHYYQGFHDVALSTTSFDQLEHLALECLRDFMTPTIAPTLDIISLLPILLLELDPTFTIIEQVEPHYALAPILTLFAHDTTNCRDILSSVEHFGLEYILYFYCSVILLSKQHIYKQLQGETEPEIVQAILTRTSAQVDVIDREELHKTALMYSNTVPIDSLKGYSRVSGWSALHGLNGLQEAAYASEKIAEPASYTGGLMTIGVLVTAFVIQWAMSR